VKRVRSRDDDVDASHVDIRSTWRFGQPWTNR